MEENKTQKPTNEEVKAISKIPILQTKKLRKWLVIVFMLLTIIVTYVVYRGKYLETIEMGEQYLSVFWKNTLNLAMTFGINFLVLYFIMYITNKGIHKGLVPFFEDEKKPIAKMPNKSIAFIVSILISFFVSKPLLEKAMVCFNCTGFGRVDPVFGYDIGFFIFVEPFLQFIINYLLKIVIGLAIYTAVYYILAFHFYFDGVDRQTLKNSKLIKKTCHYGIIIAVLYAVLLVIETFNVGLQKFLVLGKGEEAYGLWGAGLNEVTIKMWGYRILGIVIVLAIIFAVHYFKKSNTKKVLISLLCVPSYLIAMLITLVLFETIFVNPNELDKESKYITANIDSTKQAYGIDIEEVNLSENKTITTNMLEENSNVVDNISIVNKNNVLKNLNTLQTNKGYYTYRTAQIAKYEINGKTQLVYVSPREIAGSNTYNNKTYEYTHGYGTVLTSASKVDEKGNLVYLQKDFIKNSNDVVNIKEPRIYFGLETNNTAVTNSNSKKEFDYPLINSTKAENAENVYSGTAGLNLNFLDRLILAFKEGDLKLAFSGNVNKNSKILINRNIIERAKTLMPYIMYDENPYLVVTEDGRLVWVLDGYTTSNYYPFSQKIPMQENNLLKRQELNYIRNSVKVLIDAYDGTIKYYITDRNDPLIMVYQKIYKDLFVDKDENIPEDIQKQLVYPTFLYNIQAKIMEKYHNIQADVLYREDDFWEIATENTTKTLSKTGTQMNPYYTMVKTVNNENQTLGLVIPYTPSQKQNLTAYLVGTCENGQAQLTLYKYPSDSNILGPMQIDTQLEQDERIAEEIQSLNVTGTKISKNMIVVPIDDTLLYVEPIYQEYLNEENSTPTLKKVIVASGNKVAIGENLEEALENLLSKSAVDIEIKDTDSIEGLIQEIIKTNNNLKNSSSNNNWEMYGKDMAKLQELINKLEKLQKEYDKESQKDAVDVDENKANEVINSIES